MTDDTQHPGPALWDAAREEAVRRNLREGLGGYTNAHARTLLELGWRPPEKVSDDGLTKEDYETIYGWGGQDD